jgi:hypothetical protein
MDHNKCVMDVIDGIGSITHIGRNVILYEPGVVAGAEAFVFLTTFADSHNPGIIPHTIALHSMSCLYVIQVRCIGVHEDYVKRIKIVHLI